jgi:hypothetical protein
MIRNWIKKIIREVMIENFPPCNITVFDSEKSNIKLRLKGGIFVNSNIKISKEFLKEEVLIEETIVEHKKGSFIEIGKEFLKEEALVEETIV